MNASGLSGKRVADAVRGCASAGMIEHAATNAMPWGSIWSGGKPSMVATVQAWRVAAQIRTFRVSREVRESRARIAFARAGHPWPDPSCRPR